MKIGAVKAIFYLRSSMNFYQHVPHLLSGWVGDRWMMSAHSIGERVSQRMKDHSLYEPR